MITCGSETLGERREVKAGGLLKDWEFSLPESKYHSVKDAHRTT